MVAIRFIVILFFVPCFVQGQIDSNNYDRNGITIEGLGNSGTIGINLSYQRYFVMGGKTEEAMLLYSLRSGIGTCKLRFDSPRLYYFPLEFTSLVGRGRSKLELGLGYTLILGHISYQEIQHGPYKHINHTDRVIIRIGYTYKPKLTFFPLIKFAWTPMYTPNYNPIDYEIKSRFNPLWFGLSIGIVW